MKILIKLLIIPLFLSITGCNQTSSNHDKEASPNTKNNEVLPLTTPKPDFSQLIGDYLRSDGVYTLKILSATADGKVDAAYFNPNPVNVGSAKWVFKDNSFFIWVELRDVNYPGSTYTLKFFPEKKELTGNYFQATQQMNYEVVFIRQN
jgi:hypothetical protein